MCVFWHRQKIDPKLVKMNKTKKEQKCKHDGSGWLRRAATALYIVHSTWFRNRPTVIVSTTVTGDLSDASASKTKVSVPQP